MDVFRAARFVRVFVFRNQVINQSRHGNSPEEVLQDLQLFIDRGIYPDGKISEDRKIFYPEHSNTEPHGKDTL